MKGSLDALGHALNAPEMRRRIAQKERELREMKRRLNERRAINDAKSREAHRMALGKT